MEKAQITLNHAESRSNHAKSAQNSTFESDSRQITLVSREGFVQCPYMKVALRCRQPRFATTARADLACVRVFCQQNQQLYTLSSQTRVRPLDSFGFTWNHAPRPPNAPNASLKVWVVTGNLEPKARLISFKDSGFPLEIDTSMHHGQEGTCQSKHISASTHTRTTYIRDYQQLMPPSFSHAHVLQNGNLQPNRCTGRTSTAKPGHVKSFLQSFGNSIY